MEINNGDWAWLEKQYRDRLAKFIKGNGSIDEGDAYAMAGEVIQAVCGRDMRSPFDYMKVVARKRLWRKKRWEEKNHRIIKLRGRLFPRESEDPVELAYQTEISEKIESIIEGLDFTDDQKDAIRLHIYKEASASEISKATGDGIGTIRYLIRKAMNAMSRDIRRSIPLATK